MAKILYSHFTDSVMIYIRFELCQYIWNIEILGEVSLLATPIACSMTEPKSVVTVQFSKAFNWAQMLQKVNVKDSLVLQSFKS